MVQFISVLQCIVFIGTGDLTVEWKVTHFTYLNNIMIILNTSLNSLDGQKYIKLVKMLKSWFSKGVKLFYLTSSPIGWNGLLFWILQSSDNDTPYFWRPQQALAELPLELGNGLTITSHWFIWL